MAETTYGKWYQTATINGVVMNAGMKWDSSTKRWATFIKPIIPYEEGDGRIALDLGCNAGFYSRELARLGFKVTGIEREPNYLEQARYWESEEPTGIKIIEADLTKYNPPCASLAVMANVHYWIDQENLQSLIARLEKSVVHVIVIGRHKPHRRHVSPCGKPELLDLFKNWHIENHVDGRKHYSVAFKNQSLIDLKVTDIFPLQQAIESKVFFASFNQLISQILDGERTGTVTNPYYWYLKTIRRYRNADRLFETRIAMINNILENGIKTPLEIGRMVDGKWEPLKLLDGDHRLIIAKKLGIKYVVCNKKQVL